MRLKPVARLVAEFGELGLGLFIHLCGFLRLR